MGLTEKQRAEIQVIAKVCNLADLTLAELLDLAASAIALFVVWQEARDVGIVDLTVEKIKPIVARMVEHGQPSKVKPD